MTTALEALRKKYRERCIEALHSNQTMIDGVMGWRGDCVDAVLEVIAAGAERKFSYKHQSEVWVVEAE